VSRPKFEFDFDVWPWGEPWGAKCYAAPTIEDAVTAFAVDDVEGNGWGFYNLPGSPDDAVLSLEEDGRLMQARGPTGVLRFRVGIVEYEEVWSVTYE